MGNCRSAPPPWISKLSPAARNLLASIRYASRGDPFAKMDLCHLNIGRLCRAPARLPQHKVQRVALPSPPRPISLLAGVEPRPATSPRELARSPANFARGVSSHRRCAGPVGQAPCHKRAIMPSICWRRRIRWRGSSVGRSMPSARIRRLTVPCASIMYRSVRSCVWSRRFPPLAPCSLVIDVGDVAHIGRLPAAGASQRCAQSVESHHGACMAQAADRS